MLWDLFLLGENKPTCSRGEMPCVRKRQPAVSSGFTKRGSVGGIKTEVNGYLVWHSRLIANVCSWWNGDCDVMIVSAGEQLIPPPTFLHNENLPRFHGHRHWVALSPGLWLRIGLRHGRWAFFVEHWMWKCAMKQLSMFKMTMKRFNPLAMFELTMERFTH